MAIRLEDDLQAVLHFASVLGLCCLAKGCAVGFVSDDVVRDAAILVDAVNRRYAIHRICDATALGSVDAGTTVEVWMVEEVEDVEPELDAQTLTPHPPVFVDGEVGVYVTRSRARSNPHYVCRNGSDLVTDQCGCVRVQDLRPARASGTALPSSQWPLTVVLAAAKQGLQGTASGGVAHTVL